MSTINFVNKNCFEFIKSIQNNSIDLILTDPPYEISRKTGYTNGKLDKYKTLSYEFGKWDKDFDIDNYVKECYRILKPQGSIICFYDLYKITDLFNLLISLSFKQIRFIEWIKTNPVPVNSHINYLTNCREIALSAVKNSKPTFHSKYDKGIYEFPICQDKGRFHPTQKPLELLKSLLLKHSNENDTVFDGCAGSGSCALACLITNRNFIGCEINQDYFQNAQKFIDSYYINNKKGKQNDICSLL